jgi:hypothetical protein
VKKILLSFVFILSVCFDAFAAPKYEADVSVDVTDKNVSDAKHKALSKAMRDALSEVVLEISTDKSVKEINKLNDNQLEHFITGVMVLMEKTSDVRYIADLRISIDEKILKAYMAENNMPIIIGEEQEIMLIPLFEDSNGNIDVWNDNIWRKALMSYKNMQKGNLNISVIDKNLGNISMVKAESIYDMADGQYNELKNFNRVDGINVLKYSEKDLKIYIKSFPLKEERIIDISSENPADAVAQVLETFKDTKKAVAIEENNVTSVAKMEVIYNYSRLSAWATLKNLLNNNPQVQDINIVSMSTGKVHFNFKYSGAVERLQAALSASGYTLLKEGEHYVIN